MRRIHWHMCEIYALPYTNKFHGVIRMDSTCDGIRCQVILEDNKTADELGISTIINVGYNENDCREYAISVLANKEHCLTLWENLMEKDDNE